MKQAIQKEDEKSDDQKTKSINMPSNKLNLENIDIYSSKMQKMNSPRSLEALGKMGLKREDLNFISFIELKSKNPELNSLPKDLQKSRYDYLESLRLTRIEEAKKIRTEIPESNFTSNSKSFNSRKTSSNFNSNSQIKSTSIDQELKSFERLKKKQENELLNMIQYELKMELLRKENEENLRKQREKEEEQKNIFIRNRKIEEEKKREKEQKNLEILKFEDEERKKQNLERFKEEQKKIKEEILIEKERLKQAKIRQEEVNRKQEEFKKQIEEMFEENQRKMEKKQTEMEKREIFRKEIIEKKKLEAIILNMEKANRKRAKIENNMKNLENKLRMQREEYEEKQRKNEDKKKSFKIMRELAFREKKKESEKRAEEIKDVLKRNEDLIQMKILEYKEKQKIIENKKIELDNLNQIKHKEREEKYRNKENKIKQTLLKNEKIINDKKMITLQKIHQNEIKVEEISKIKERELMEKSENSCYKRIEKEEKLKQLTRIQENERTKVLERLNEKSQRLDEIKFQKSLIQEQKREIFDEIVKKKQEYTEKFENIFRKKVIDEKSISKLERMFPDKPDIQIMIQTLKSGNFENKSRSTALTNARDISQTKSQSQNQSRFESNCNPQFNKINNLDCMKNFSSTASDGNNFYNSNKMPIIHVNNYNKKSDNEVTSHEINNLNKGKILYNKLLTTAIINTNKLDIKFNEDKNIENNLYNNSVQDNAKVNKINQISGLSYSSYKSDSKQLNKSKEEEIEKRVNEYRLKLNQNFLKILAEERQKEDERERILLNTKDPIERKKLDEMFGYDRAQASNRILKHNDEIEKKIQEYRKQSIIQT